MPASRMINTGKLQLVSNGVHGTTLFMAQITALYGMVMQRVFIPIIKTMAQ